MPTGKPVFIAERHMHTYPFKKLFGFFKVTVYAPTHLYTPLLPYRNPSGRLVYPLGSFTGVYFSEELKHYVKYGYKYKVHSGYHWPESQRTQAFKGYVEGLYSKRLEASKGLWPF